MKLFKRIMALSGCLMVASVISVSAIEYSCQSTKQTGVGYVNATCNGTWLNAHAFYDSSSERYHVNMYLGPTGSPYTWVAGVNAGTRNGYINRNVNMTWNQYGHIHSYSKNLI